MSQNFKNDKPRHRVPPSSSKPVSSRQVFTSAGAPDGYDEEAVLLKAMEENKRRCLGGWIVHCKDHSGFPVVCHALPTALIQSERKQLSWWYHWTASNNAGIFPGYTYSVSAGDYIFFRFSMPEGAVSMREMMNNPEREGLCKNLFTDLVMLLHRYSQKCEKSAGEYRPLCALSLDTVFMDPSGQLCILPLLCVSDEYPRGFPLEVGTEEVDDTTDLYTAALLTYQVLSGCEYEKHSENKRMRVLKTPANMVDCMEQSLKPFASQRSSLQEIYAQLTRETPPTEAPQNNGKNKRRPHETRQTREPEAPQDAGFWVMMRNLHQKLSSIIGTESILETSRTAGRPKTEPKRSGHMWYGSIFEEEDVDDDCDYEDDEAFDYDEDEAFDYDEGEPFDYDEEP